MNNVGVIAYISDKADDKEVELFWYEYFKKYTMDNLIAVTNDLDMIPPEYKTNNIMLCASTMRFIIVFDD